MIDCLIGVAITWIACGSIAIYTQCMPSYSGDKWSAVPLFYALLFILFGPFSQVMVVKAHNEVAFPKTKHKE